MDNCTPTDVLIIAKQLLLTMNIEDSKQETIHLDFQTIASNNRFNNFTISEYIKQLMQYGAIEEITIEVHKENQLRQEVGSISASEIDQESIDNIPLFMYLEGIYISSNDYLIYFIDINKNKLLEFILENIGRWKAMSTSSNTTNVYTSEKQITTVLKVLQKLLLNGYNKKAISLIEIADKALEFHSTLLFLELEKFLSITYIKKTSKNELLEYTVNITDSFNKQLVEDFFTNDFLYFILNKEGIKDEKIVYNNSTLEFQRVVHQLNGGKFSIPYHIFQLASKNINNSVTVENIINEIQNIDRLQIIKSILTFNAYLRKKWHLTEKFKVIYEKNNVIYFNKIVFFLKE